MTDKQKERDSFHKDGKKFDFDEKLEDRETVKIEDKKEDQPMRVDTAPDLPAEPAHEDETPAFFKNLEDD